MVPMKWSKYGKLLLQRLCGVIEILEHILFIKACQCALSYPHYYISNSKNAIGKLV